jgi:hypothetical protein
MFHCMLAFVHLFLQGPPAIYALNTPVVWTCFAPTLPLPPPLTDNVDTTVQPQVANVPEDFVLSLDSIIEGVYSARKELLSLQPQDPNGPLCVSTQSNTDEINQVCLLCLLALVPSLTHHAAAVD